MQAGDRRAAFCSAVRVDLGRVDHAHLDEIAVLLGLGVEAEVALALDDLVEHHRRLVAGVGDDGAQRLLERARDDLDAGVLVVVVALQLVERLAGADQRDAAAGDDAFLDRGTGGVQRVLDAGLLLLHLDFGRGADLDHRHAAGELRHALLQLLLVVVAGRLLDLLADVLDARLDALGVAGAVDDGGLFLADLDALRAAEILQRRLLEREARAPRRSRCRR